MIYSVQLKLRFLASYLASTFQCSSCQKIEGILPVFRGFLTRRTLKSLAISALKTAISTALSIAYFRLILILALLPTASFAAKQTDHISKRIDKIITQCDQNLNIGILVQDVNTGKTLYRKNADRYFTPASNEKLFTAFAALHYLGADFTYQTRIAADVTKIQNGTLQDNLYLQFTGDPSLTFAQLDRLIGTLSQKGIRRINGRIIIDDTAFDQIFASPGTSWDDKDFDFGAPISALIIDHNGAKITIAPAETPGQPARITLPQQPQFMYFINRAMTYAPTVTECKLDTVPINENTYLISGCVKTTDSPQEISMAIHHPRTNIQSVLFYLLKKHQITNAHPIEFQKINGSPTLFASESSPPLSTLINQMLKESDNIIADALFKTMGSIYTHQTGSWQNGSNAIHNILTNSIGLTMPTSTLIDGSGLSRYNYVTPQQILTLLKKVYSSKQRAAFIASLPISGVDGTLKNRMDTPGIRGKVQAKTGTETAITALSGYLTTQKKHTLIFSILINGFIDSPLKYKVLEDQICTVLVNPCV